MRSRTILSRCATHLDDGEVIIAAARATPVGSVPARIVDVVLHGIGVRPPIVDNPVAWSASDRRFVPGLRGAAPACRQVVLLLTDAHVLMLPIDAAGRPSPPIASVGLDDVVGMDLGRSVAAGVRVGSLQLRTRDGALAFVVAPPHRRDAERLADAVDQRLATRRGSGI